MSVMSVCTCRPRRGWHLGLWWKLSSTCQTTTAACVSVTCWDGQLSSAICSSSLILWDRYWFFCVCKFCTFRLHAFQNVTSQCCSIKNLVHLWLWMCTGLSSCNSWYCVELLIFVYFPFLFHIWTKLHRLVLVKS